MKLAIHLTEAGRLKAYEDLRQGSNPRGAFFLLVALSTIIAAFGLVMNSTAVVIGAMLVAPLMMPILGLGLGLIRGDSQLIGSALRAEVAGVLLAIAVATLLGMILPHFEETPEMLSRTTPNLLDLLVAVFAGIAGAYALVDERISPALPGVAISTAIVPPLANTGLSIALGAYTGAWGSFLLFFTNFLSILLVSAFVFSIAGMAEEIRLRSGISIIGRFSVALVSFMLVAALLSRELLNIVEHQWQDKQIRNTLQTEFARHRINDPERLVHKKEGEKLFVLAEVKGARILSPQRVSAIQAQLEAKIGKPVKLSIRTTVTHHVSATGSIDQAFEETLDGFNIADEQDQRIRVLEAAEQIIRENFGHKLGFDLEGLRLYPSEAEMLVVVKVSSAKWLSKRETAEIEALIQKRFKPLSINLLIVQEIQSLRDAKGGLRLQFTTFRSLAEEEIVVIDRIEELANRWLSQKRYWLDNRSIVILDGVYHVLLEVRGPSLFTKEDWQMLKKYLTDEVDAEIELFVRSVPEVVVGERGFIPFEILLDNYDQRIQAEYGGQIQRLIHEFR